MRKFLLFLLTLLLAAPAFARIFPANIRYGIVNDVTPATATIDSVSFHRAAGLRIMNERNMLIFLHQLPVKTKVAYQIDLRGELFQVWILTPAEMAGKQIGPTPPININD